MKSRLVLIVEAAFLAGALALAAPAVAGAASPAKGGHGSTTTTTTTKPGSSSGSAAAFATLVIKPASIGHVSVEQAGTTTFTAGTNNEQLHVGDTVQTDTVGLAEIDYATNAYTRLNVNTTFTIKKLTDNQGNRQVDGGLTSGETWNRTAQLTQSESFQQDGGGVTAAVSGTAFVANCTTPTACTFTAVIDNTNLTGPNGQTETLNPLTQCVTQNATLCASPTMLTPDQLALIQWIQYNVYLDLAEHGIGNGVFDPFSVTVTVTNGVVTSVTPTTTGQGFTPATNPTPPPAPTIDPNPIVIGNAGSYNSPLLTSSTCGPAIAPVATDSVTVGDDCAFDFTLNLTGAGTVQFTLTGNIATGGVGIIVDQSMHGITVTSTGTYGATDAFTFEATDCSSSPSCDIGNAAFSYAATGPGGTSLSNQVAVSVVDDCDGGEACPSSTATANDSTTPPGPVTPAPLTTNTNTPSTTTSTSTPPTSNPATGTTGSGEAPASN